VKIGLDGSPTVAWTAGIAVIAQSGQVLQGDESNQTAPLAGFWTLALHSEYAFSKTFSVFGRVDNALNRRYDVYGAFTNQSGVPYPAIPGGATDPRTVTPAPPFAAALGLRVKI
jgi:outer membrane receptor protein involved in Fe transport